MFTVASFLLGANLACARYRNLMDKKNSTCHVEGHWPMDFIVLTRHCCLWREGHRIPPSNLLISKLIWCSRLQDPCVCRPNLSFSHDFISVRKKPKGTTNNSWLPIGLVTLRWEICSYGVIALDCEHWSQYFKGVANTNPHSSRLVAVCSPSCYRCTVSCRGSV